MSLIFDMKAFMYETIDIGQGAPLQVRQIDILPGLKDGDSNEAKHVRHDSLP